MNDIRKDQIIRRLAAIEFSTLVIGAFWIIAFVSKRPAGGAL